MAEISPLRIFFLIFSRFCELISICIGLAHIKFRVLGLERHMNVDSGQGVEKSKLTRFKLVTNNANLGNIDSPSSVIVFFQSNV